LSLQTDFVGRIANPASTHPALFCSRCKGTVVLGQLSDWLDHRTGYRKIRDALLIEHIPGGAKWRYVWGSCLVFVFTVQLITGVLLMTAYSPGDSTAWGSVYFIQYEMDFGWLIRGLHHFGSQTMVVLLGLHMLQVVIAGAHLPPREVNWWLGLALMGIVLGLSLTGYLLPWDQKGYWATQVATNIMGNVPFGSFLQKLVVGGPEYGHHTLTHFYSLHVGILPPLMIVLVIAHMAVFRRHGVTAPANAQGEGVFWPTQAFKDLLASLVIFGIMLSLVVFGGHGNKLEVPAADGAEPGLYEQMARAGRDGLGANLDAPADPSIPYPARPEWYFLFLFQLLKYFEGSQEIVGTVIIPTGVGVLLFILPLLGIGRLRKFGHFIGIVVVVALLLGAAVLTFLAIADDSATPILGVGGTKKAQDLQEEFAAANLAAQRAVNLAHEGIPAEGGRELLRKDPKTRGRKLFGDNCAVCHRFTADLKKDGFEGFVKGPFKASDLAGFGTKEWIRGLLENPADDKFFGRTGLKEMTSWRKGIDRKRKKMKEQTKEIEKQDREFDDIAAFLADQAKPKEDRDKKLGEQGLTLFMDHCSECHSMAGQPAERKAPDFTDYGSQEWIRLMIMSPAHPLRHAARNEMPAFRNLDGPGAEVHRLEFEAGNKDADSKQKANVINLSDIERELIIRFMTRDYRVVFGGQTISDPPKR
jgi:ubiquinol-cytochrome c reductase cytochrome b subunit